MTNAKREYIFHPFETAASYDPSVSLISLTLDQNGFKIYVDGQSKRYIFTFMSTCPFRRTDEGDWVNQELDYTFLNPDKLVCTFVGDSSDFIDTLCKYSQWGHDPSSYGKHYIFATEDDVIDVISKNPPRVSIEEK
jgi:hypothetical protein